MRADLSHGETPETWWIETRPTRWGWKAIAKSSRDQILGVSVEGHGGFPVWRPTERWAHRAVLRALRSYQERQRRLARADDLTRVYPVDS